jgi:hypothetical protein
MERDMLTQSLLHDADCGVVAAVCALCLGCMHTYSAERACKALASSIVHQRSTTVC